jgi:hypothetical protein
MILATIDRAVVVLSIAAAPALDVVRATNTRGDEVAVAAPVETRVV